VSSVHLDSLALAVEGRSGEPLRSGLTGARMPGLEAMPAAMPASWDKGQKTLPM